MKRRFAQVDVFTEVAFAGNPLAVVIDGHGLTVLSVTINSGEFKVGIIGPSIDPTYAYEVRAFFPFDGGVEEDPVTGSLNAGLAQWLIGAGIAKPPYVVKQGTHRSRDGRITISTDERGAVWVGGSVLTCIEGTVDL
jgi:predicted PhzF superfamily epimerase YddE/YHI9